MEVCTGISFCDLLGLITITRTDTVVLTATGTAANLKLPTQKRHDSDQETVVTIPARACQQIFASAAPVLNINLNVFLSIKYRSKTLFILPYTI